jgi:hypothetical protein
MPGPKLTDSDSARSNAWITCWYERQVSLAWSSSAGRTVLLLFNAYHDVVQFRLPEVVGGDGWMRLLDTNLPDTWARPSRSTASERAAPSFQFSGAISCPSGRSQDTSLAVLLDGRAQTSGLHVRGAEATVLLLFNAYHDVVPAPSFQFSGAISCPSGRSQDTSLTPSSSS